MLTFLPQVGSIYSAVHSCTLILLWNDTKEWMFQVFLKLQIASIVAVE